MTLFLGYNSPNQQRPSQTARPSETNRPQRPSQADRPIQNAYYNASDVGPSDSISQIAYRQPAVPSPASQMPSPYQPQPIQQQPYQSPPIQQQPYQSPPVSRAQNADPYLLRQNQGMMSPPPNTQVGYIRKRTVKQIPLTPQGNLVIDVPVAARVSKMGKYGVGDEFTHMRYTAVTCPPDEFAKRGYSLRQQELQRSTEVFIVVTM